MRDKYIKKNAKSRYHYLGENLLVRNRMFDYMSLNPLQEMLLLLADGSRTYEDIYHIILQKFEIEDTEKNSNLYDTLLAYLKQHELIDYQEVQSCSPIEISGEKGKYYPDWILVEATSNCNFFCPHCYKEANIHGMHLTDKNFKKIVAEMKGKASNMLITGGEPCCNPWINDILVLAEQNFEAYLLTNGYYLKKVPIEILTQLKGIQITLYGYDEESYYKFTGIKDAFSKVYDSICRLTGNTVKVALTTIVTRDNVEVLEKYVTVAMEVGAKSLMFGLSAPLGRLQPHDERFVFDSGTLKTIRENVLILREKYKGKIEIVKMGDLTSFTPSDSSTFNCQAGKLNIVITENNEVVPCHMVTRKMFEGYSFDEYISDMKAGKIRDYTAQVKKFRQYMESRGTKAQDMYCTGFCNIPS